jgi:hypothetical protein
MLTGTRSDHFSKTLGSCCSRKLPKGGDNLFGCILGACMEVNALARSYKFQEDMFSLDRVVS